MSIPFYYHNRRRPGRMRSRPAGSFARLPGCAARDEAAAFSPAHTMEGLAELVCSNSLRSDGITNGSGLLKAELRLLGLSRYCRS